MVPFSLVSPVSHVSLEMRSANLGVAFGVKLRYIARCCFAVEKLSVLRTKERRKENTNQSTLEGEVFAGKNTRPF
jgi:hypothetical protein